MKKNKIIYLSIAIITVIAVLIIIVITSMKGEPKEQKAYVVKDGEVSYVYEGLINTNIRHTFKSVNYIDGDNLKDNDKYKLEYYGDMKYPELKQAHSGDVDLEAFYRDYPEWKELLDCLENHEDPDFKKYPNEERIRICKQFEDHIDEYTYEGYENDKCFCFVECTFENTQDKECYLNLANLECLIYDDVDAVYEPSGIELIYFDKSQNTEGIARNSLYYEYKLQPGEKLDCTIGFEFSHYSRDNSKAPTLEQLYLGYYDEAEYNDPQNNGSTWEVLTKGKYMFKLSDLKKID